MEFPKGICNLCLGKCESFKAVDVNTKNAFDLLLLKIDLIVTQEPLMCKNCAEMLIKCCDFKKKCLRIFRTHDYIIPFVNRKNGVKLDLKDLYLNKDATDNGALKDQNVCVCCLSLVKKYSSLSFDVEDRDNMLKEMIEQCLPELDLNIFKKPVICVTCHGYLEKCFHFVKNCLIVEEKIKKYCETLDVDDKSRIDLSSLLKFTTSDLTTSKIKEQFYEYSDNPDLVEIGNGGEAIKLEQMFFDDTFTEMEDQKVNIEHQITPKNMLDCEEESSTLGFIKKEDVLSEDNDTKQKGENPVEMGDQKYLLDEEIEIKTDEHDSSGFENEYIEQTLPNENDSIITVYQCKCCSYQTEYKQNLKKHLLVHKDPSEVTMYNCDSCSLQTKHYGSFKTHLLLHKDPSDVTMHKCESCSYQTNRKGYLRQHVLKHKDPPEVTMYKCKSCLYQTKYKASLKTHVLKHRDTSQITMYKCESCLYQTKRKGDLRSHMLKHKDPSEITMLRCYYCSFQTKYECSLKLHALKHKNPSEVTTYKCDHCSYRTKHVGNLKIHMVMHKDPSEVTMYKCHYCSYQSKRKGGLKIHLSKHKDLQR